MKAKYFSLFINVCIFLFIVSHKNYSQSTTDLKVVRFITSNYLLHIQNESEYSILPPIIDVDNIYGYFNDTTNEIEIPFIYSNARDFSNNCAAVIPIDKSNNGKWIFINKKGQMISDYYDEVRDFSDGLAAVKKNGKWGFINNVGKQIIISNYDFLGSFVNGLSCAFIYGKGYGFIDIKGNEKIPFKYYLAYDFSEGLAAVKHFSDGWGFIDVNNNLVIPYQYEDVKSFSEGLAAVKQNGKWGYIDKNGKWKINNVYFNASPFHNGYSYIKRTVYTEDSDIWDIIDTTGSIVIERRTFFDKLDFNSYFTVTYPCNDYKDKKMTIYLNKNTRQKISYPFGFDFSENYAAIKLENNKWGFIDTSGSIKISCKYYSSYKFVNGIALIKINDDKYGFIDKNNNLLGNSLYDYIESFSYDLAVVKINNKYGFINRDGQIIIQCIYDAVKRFHYGVAAVCKDSKWALINNKGQTITQFKYHDIIYLPNKYFLVKEWVGSSNLKSYYVDLKGNFIKN